MSKTINLATEETNRLNTIIEAKNLISEKERKELRILYNQARTDNCKLGILFSTCYGSLSIFCDSLFDKTMDLRIKIRIFLDYYEELHEAVRVHHATQKYLRANRGIGSSHYEFMIQTAVENYRKEYKEFIAFFFKIAGIEE